MVRGTSLPWHDLAVRPSSALSSAPSTTLTARAGVTYRIAARDANAAQSPRRPGPLGAEPLPLPPQSRPGESESRNRLREPPPARPRPRDRLHRSSDGSLATLGDDALAAQGPDFLLQPFLDHGDQLRRLLARRRAARRGRAPRPSREARGLARGSGRRDDRRGEDPRCRD